MEKKSNLGNTALKVFAIADYTVFYLHVVCFFLYQLAYGTSIVKPIETLAKSSEVVQKIVDIFLDDITGFGFTLLIGIVGCIILAVICKANKKRRLGVILLMPLFLVISCMLSPTVYVLGSFSDILTGAVIVLFVVALACMYIFFVDTAVKAESAENDDMRSPRKKCILSETIVKKALGVLSIINCVFCGLTFLVMDVPEIIYDDGQGFLVMFINIVLSAVTLVFWTAYCFCKREENKKLQLITSLSVVVYAALLVNWYTALCTAFSVIVLPFFFPVLFNILVLTCSKPKQRGA